MKYLIVVDMQNDFITGALGSAAAEAILPRALDYVRDFAGEVIFTRDTHTADYLSTQEGKKLPVPHCIKDSAGWEICDALRPYAKTVLDKPTFGSVELPHLLAARGEVEEVFFLGLCTDICVISNAMLVKAAFPEARVAILSDACAGVSEESHNTALSAMRAVQIEVL